MAILKTIRTGELQVIDKDYRDKQTIQTVKDNILIVKMITKIEELTKEIRRK